MELTAGPPLCTALQESFARHYALTMDAVEAYKASYETAGRSPKHIAKAASQTLRTPVVDARIRELLNLAAGGDLDTLSKVFGYLTDIISADPNELVSVKIGCCRYCHGDGHQYQWRLHEYLSALGEAETYNESRGKRPAQNLPDPAGGFDFDATAPALEDCPGCHGEGEPRVVFKDTETLSPKARRLYGGAKMTNTGMQVIMADQGKALEMAIRMLGGFQDNLNIKGELKAMVAVANLDPKDPNAAARAYQDMIAGKLTAPSD